MTWYTYRNTVEACGPDVGGAMGALVYYPPEKKLQNLTSNIFPAVSMDIYDRFNSY
jgi:hypothetical protein